MWENKLTLGLFLFVLMVGPGLAQAHSADTFTVVIKQSGLTPSSSQIAYNDSVVWHNVDSRENLTHRIVFDSDGDGLYNGTADWDSGELSSECNTTENNTSDDCKIRFMVWFNGTWGVGEYNYQSILSNGETYNGTIIVTEDVHVEEPMPGIGSTFGVTDEPEVAEEDSESNTDDKKRMILLIGGFSGIGAFVLLLLLLRKSE